MANTNQSTKVVTGKVRFSYVHVFEPHSMEEGQEKKYSVCLLIPKTDKATIDKINKAIEAAKQAGIAKFGGKVPPNLKTPLRDGDEEREGEEYKGHYFINASSKQRPGVVDASVQPILDSTEVYSGGYGRASINFYAYAVSGSRGIAAGLNHLQWLEDGPYLGGRNRAEDDFEVVEGVDAGFLD